MALIAHIILAIVATTIDGRYTKTSDCFILEGLATNGTSFGVLNVGVWSLAPEFVFGVFVNSNGLNGVATKLGIDGGTGHLMDRDQGGVSIGETFIPYKGRLASVAKSGQTSDYLWFKSPETLRNETTWPHVPVKCRLSYTGRLTCSHPNVRDYNVFQYCAPYPGVFDIFPALYLGTGIDPPNSLMYCEAVTVIARVTQGCLL